MAPSDPIHSLQSEDQLRLLDEIDKLRSQGISHYVSLPQLIVCGDQSSGKSSVLEAISGITFPTKDNLCTRFATEVILRKAQTASVSVGIVPSQTRSEAECNRLLGFSETLEDLSQFSTLVEKAKESMGISTTTSAFSNDVLRVEVSGPDRPHLTIVDLPGLIHSENKLQSSADVALVWEMVKNYMKNKRSIILAVISAKNDYANQIVLKLAKEVDASGNRTLGIITKPDTLSVGSESEAAFMELARNEDVKFRLGWHVLKNRSYETRDSSTEERNAAETDFFERGVWKSLTRSMVGITPLRGRLSKVLLEQITAELPTLVKDIQQAVQDSEERLSKLGANRATVDEQRLFLLRIAQSFQSLCKAAVDGVYTDPFFGDANTDEGYIKRLRAVVVKANKEYANEMRERGQTRLILDQTPVGDAKQLKEMGYRTKKISRADFEDEIVGLLERSRGRELPGMFNPLLVEDVFHQQSSLWGGIAREHTNVVCKDVKIFLELTVSHLADEHTSSNLLRHVIDPHLETDARRVNEKLGEVLAPHIYGHPMTYNHYFTETIQDIRKERQEKDLIVRLQMMNPWGSGKGEIAKFPEGTKISDLASKLASRNEADMDKYAASEILLCTEAYYKVAMKVLVDNVAAQVIEACVLATLSEILSPTSILEMDSALVTAIAAEPMESQAEREQLTRKLGVLKSGLDICKRYGSRPVYSAVKRNKPNGANASNPVAVSVDGIRRARSISPRPDGPLQDLMVEHEHSQPRSLFSKTFGSASAASSVVEGTEEQTSASAAVPKISYEFSRSSPETPQTAPSESRPAPARTSNRFDNSGWTSDWRPAFDLWAAKSSEAKKTPEPERKSKNMVAEREALVMPFGSSPALLFQSLGSEIKGGQEKS